MPRIALAVGSAALLCAAAGAGIGVLVFHSVDHAPPAAVSVGKTCTLQTEVPHTPTLWIQVSGGPSFCANVINVLKGYLPSGSQVYMVQHAPDKTETVDKRGGVIVKAKPGSVSPSLAHEIATGLANVGQ